MGININKPLSLLNPYERGYYIIVEKYHRIPLANIRRAIADLIFGKVDISPNEVNNEVNPKIDATAEAQVWAALQDRDEALRIRMEMDLDQLRAESQAEGWSEYHDGRTG